MAGQTTIVVIGAGIIGLTVALRLLDSLDQSKYKILIVSREWPTSIPGAPTKHSVNYASMWAGAHVRPIPASTPQLGREAAWLKQTVHKFASQLHHPSMIGLTKCKGVEFLEAPPEAYLQQSLASFSSESGLDNYRQYNPAELPDGVQLGYEYNTYCINAPLYCASLLRNFIVRGGKCLDRHLAGEWEGYNVGPRVGLVINASGTGFGDKKCFPTKGQTVLAGFESATTTVTKQKRDGSWSFIIPRFFGGGTIIGGTKQPGDWETEPDLATRQSLLLEAGSIIDYATDDHVALDDVSIVADIVGRRPTREGGMQIEIEYPKSLAAGFEQTKPVLHAYGAGGRGFEISWGVADEVAGLAQDVLEQRSDVRAKL